MNSKQWDILDLIGILTVIMQLVGYESDKQSISNDEIMHELQMQNEKYLEDILRNQKMIIDKLAELSS